VILAAYYMLRMYGRVMFGPARGENAILPDLGRREIAVLAPLVALIVWIGVYPAPFLERTAPSTDRFVARVRPAESVPAGAVALDLEEPASGRPSPVEPPGASGR
jgi:NADH-quinone oxidoreductase subunit M